MATYLILNIVVIIAACLLFRVHVRRPSNAWIVTFIGLLILTAIFDNFIIWAEIVGYDTSKLLGIYIGIAPIEDFMYSILAIIIVPTLWNKLGDHHVRKH